MPQENIFPKEEDEITKIKGKALVLYFVQSVDRPVSNSQISYFGQSLKFMNFYEIQNHLGDLVKSGMLEKTFTDNKLFYTITKEGKRAAEAFWELIPKMQRDEATTYLSENLKIIKQEHEVYADYFYDPKNDEYIVKCAAFEEDLTLMELSVSVVSRDAAAFICTNWKGDAAGIYGKIIKALTTAE